MAYQQTMKAGNRYQSSDLPKDDYYSVEFSVENVNFLYQFKIWKDESTPRFVLIKKGSDIIRFIKPGDVLTLTYYCNGKPQPTRRQLPTEILDILWQDQGRFKGHYMVSLGVAVN